MAKPTSKKAKKAPAPAAATPKTPQPPAEASATPKTPQAPAKGTKNRVASSNPPGRPRKTGKENQDPVSPLAPAHPPSALVPSSDDTASEPNASTEVQAHGAPQKEPAPQKDHGASNREVPPEVEIIRRPKGEAGNTVDGFNLQNAMGLADNTPFYNEIQRELHLQVIANKIDVTVRFPQQDVEKLSNIYRKMRKEFPYLTTDRFPANWPVAEMVKIYLKNLRKVAGKRNRMRAELAAAAGKSTPSSSMGTHAGVKRRRLADDE